MKSEFIIFVFSFLSQQIYSRDVIKCKYVFPFEIYSRTIKRDNDCCSHSDLLRFPEIIIMVFVERPISQTIDNVKTDVDVKKLLTSVQVVSYKEDFSMSKIRFEEL